MVFCACATDAAAPPRGDEHDTGESVETARRVAGRVTGLAADVSARVILGNDTFLDSSPVADGRFELASVPDGTYFAKLDVAGYATSATQLVTVHDGAGRVELSATALPDDGFHYAWHEDASRGGHELSSDLAPESAPARQLLDHYNILLSDEGQPWTQEHAARLLQMMRAVPQQVRAVSQRYWINPSSWMLFSGGLDDLDVTRTPSGDTVRISTAAFSDPDPQMLAVGGQRDAYFAKRLHRAVVRYVTHDGAAKAAVDRILAQRYGVTTAVADYAALTASTTRETADSFQSFGPGELVDLISMFEEMPEGFRAIPRLTTVVRRKDRAASSALAWTTAGYLEVSTAAFTGSRDETHRALVREKARFFVTPTLEATWSTMGMDETLPEAIATYVRAPEVMRARSVEGFELIRDRIMHGELELDPDRKRAGQIVEVAIRTVDEPELGKRIIVELGLRTDGLSFTGASSAAIRLYSEAGSSVTLELAPATVSGSVVRGEIVLEAAQPGGFWRPDQIVVRDPGGSAVAHSVFDVGWKLFID
jgi:hypothetical protein